MDAESSQTCRCAVQTRSAPSRTLLIYWVVLFYWVVLSSLVLGPPCQAASPLLDASRLADLPSTIGVAAPFVGVAGKALIVGGGTNFPDAPPWENGTKIWHDSAYVLPSPAGRWRAGFKLPRRLAYGVSITTEKGLLCVGGCDETRNFADVFLLHWDGMELSRQIFPSLPQPTSCAAGVLIGSRVYVAGGQAGPNPLEGPSSSQFCWLNLDDAQPTWRELPTWPGPERFYAVAGTDGASFFLFSGIRRILNPQGQPALEYMNDAYRFDPADDPADEPDGGRWTRLADLPHPNAAVASPAPFVDGGLLLLGQGANGVGIDLPLQERAPFGREVLRYAVAADHWETVGRLAFGLAAVPAAQWHGRTVIASGESRPGVRSPAVWLTGLRPTTARSVSPLP